MKVVCRHVSTFQEIQAVHDSGAQPEQPEHMLPDLRLLSYPPYDLADADPESGIVQILAFGVNLENGGPITAQQY